MRNGMVAVWPRRFGGSGRKPDQPGPRSGCAQVKLGGSCTDLGTHHQTRLKIYWFQQLRRGNEMPCDMGMGNASFGDSTDWTARREAERLTRVSCDIMGILEKAGVDFSAFSEETKSWWRQHKAHDAQKAAAAQAQQQREQHRQQALAKLTPAERKALGL